MTTTINVFDRVLKVLARNYAERFLELALPDVPLRLAGTLENVELAIPEERVDFVHRVMWEEQEYLFHIEFQTEHRADMPERLFVYSALLTKQTGLPVITLVVYLARREAPLPSAYQVQVGNVVLNRFEYPVVKLWEYADEIAAGRWPELAPLLVTLVKEPDEAVLARERELILREEDRYRQADLLACAVTIGARYFDKEFLWKFFREEVEMMREATFIDEWLEEKLEQGLQQGLQQGFQQGKRQTQQRLLLRILRHRFGEVPLRLEERLGVLTAEQLETLTDLALDVPDLGEFSAVVENLTIAVQPVFA